MTGISSFDFFPKTTEDVRIKTLSGAIVSIVTIILSFILLAGEVSDYMFPAIHEGMQVDVSFDETIDIHFDMSFPGSACSATYFDVVDSFGEEQIGIPPSVTKTEIDMGPKKGCNMQGSLRVNKVAGNFHFALGQGIPNTAVGNDGTGHGIAGKVGAQHQHMFNFHELKIFNASHHIHKLWFGESYPGMGTLPLDGVVKEVASGVGQYNYYIQVVPTQYIDKRGNVLKTNQYSVTEKAVEVKNTNEAFPHPGCFFFYDIAPLVVIVKEDSISFASFVTRVCAIVGGVFVTASIVDKLVYSWMKQAIDESK